MFDVSSALHYLEWGFCPLPSICAWTPAYILRWTWALLSYFTFWQNPALRSGGQICSLWELLTGLLFFSPLPFLQLQKQRTLSGKRDSDRFLEKWRDVSYCSVENGSFNVWLRVWWSGRKICFVRNAGGCRNWSFAWHWHAWSWCHEHHGCVRMRDASLIEDPDVYFQYEPFQWWLKGSICEMKVVEKLVRCSGGC